MNKIIAFSGGHHNSALVLARDLSKKGYKIIWLGHKYAGKNDTNESAEFIEVTNSGFKFYDLKAGKIGTSPSFGSILKIPLGFIHAYSLLKKQKADLVISFGSYLGLTTSIAAWLQNIPVFIHEQTSVVGKANLLSAKFASKIFTSWETSSKYFPDFKTKLVGIPLRNSILKPSRINFFKNDLPTILVIGGKQGSHFINTLILENLNDLLNDYNIILQTGTSSQTNDLEKSINIKESLGEKLSSKFMVVGYISEDDIGAYINSSDLVISRSGAHTTYELAILKKKCILIPFMHTYKNEQYKNAKILEDTGQAIILPQSTTNYSKLKSAINKMYKLEDFKTIRVPQNATEKISQEITEFFK